MKIAIVDDERPARSELIFLLTELLPDAEFREADSAQSAKELLEKESFDVAFLDINLGDVNGTAVASFIKMHYPETAVVFVTAYQDYAAQAFDLDAVDYVMKPFDAKRLKRTLEKLEKMRYLQEPRKAEKSGKLAVNGGDHIKVLSARQIVYIEAKARSCYIYTADGCYQENIAMSHLEERLPGNKFYRVHKSFLVNLDMVEELIPSYNNGYAMRMKYYPQVEIPIGRTQIKNIKQLFGL